MMKRRNLVYLYLYKYKWQWATANWTRNQQVVVRLVGFDEVREEEEKDEESR